ncbi:unnamed protein product, partial [Iphiclides podalirius]
MSRKCVEFPAANGSFQRTRGEDQTKTEPPPSHNTEGTGVTRAIALSRGACGSMPPRGGCDKRTAGERYARCARRDETELTDY